MNIVYIYKIRHVLGILYYYLNIMMDRVSERNLIFLYPESAKKNSLSDKLSKAFREWMQKKKKRLKSMFRMIPGCTKI